MPIAFRQKIVNCLFICLFLNFLNITIQYAQSRSDSVRIHHNIDSLSYQPIKSLAELETRLEQTQKDLQQKQAELRILDEKIKAKELILDEKLKENKPQKSGAGLFTQYSFIFFIIGIICLIFSFIRIKKPDDRFK